MRKFMYLMTALLLAAAASCVHGQGTPSDKKADIQKKLSEKFVLTVATADKSDIVTPGSSIVLQKPGLLMYSVDTQVPPTSNYKDGKISMGFGSAFGTGLALGMAQPGSDTTNVPQRKFVQGEKVWITALSVKDDGVILTFYSDPYNGVRYYGQLKFSYNKKAIPSLDDFMRTVGEVLTVEAPEAPAPKAAPEPAPTPVADPVPDKAPPPIEAPPPPPDSPPPEPKTIKIGQTEDMVVAILGQPTKIVKLTNKEIYYYADMKITFVNKKVSDVQ